MRISPRSTQALTLFLVLGAASTALSQFADRRESSTNEFSTNEFPSRETGYDSRSARDAGTSVIPATANIPVSPGLSSTSESSSGAANRIGPLVIGKGEPEKPPREHAASPKLPPPRDPGRLGRPSSSPTGALFTVMGSLGIVLGLFLLVVWFTRRALPRAATSLPSDVVELLGRTPLSPRQNMHVIRFGPKLLLVSVTQGGAETLSEITDADEVERVTGLCKQNQPGSVTATFRQVLSQFAREPAPGGFLGVESGVSRATPNSTEARTSVSGSARRRAAESTEV